MSLGDVVTQLGGAAAALFGSKGASAQAADYQGAATLATQNAQLAGASTRIQETQMERSVTQSLGTTQADVAGAGFTLSGSALDLLKSSAQQGALAKSLVNIQGAINENSYAAQAGAYAGEAKAANEASKAGQVSAIASVGGALINGVGSLASAGQTVAKGYNYITGLFTGSTDSAAAAAGIAQDAGVWVNAAGDSVAAGTPGAFQLTAEQASSLADTGTFSSLFSSTDASISAGADLSALEGTTDIGVDTSAIALGTSEDAASAGISDAISQSLGVGSIGDILIPAGIGAVVGGLVGGKTGSIIGGLGGAALAIALSVICTSFYRRGMVSREAWLGAQRYGMALDPIIFNGYVFWAAPIARRINSSKRFAKLMAPIFVPPVNEMAAIMGQKNVKRTLYGFVSHRMLLGLSWVIGQMIAKPNGGLYETRA